MRRAEITWYLADFSLSKEVDQSWCQNLRKQLESMKCLWCHDPFAQLIALYMHAIEEYPTQTVDMISCTT